MIVSDSLMALVLSAIVIAIVLIVLIRVTSGKHPVIDKQAYQSDWNIKERKRHR